MNRYSRIVGFLTVLVMLAGLVSAQASTLDQNNPPNNVGLNDSLEWQQQVTAGIGGQLAGITLYTNAGPDTDLVQIAIGSGFYSGPYTFSQTVTINGATFIDTSSAGILLTPGETFVIDVSEGPGCCNLSGSDIPYGGGDLYLNFGNGDVEDYTQLFGYSMAFQTYMNPSTPTPEPCSMLLVGAGLGLVGVWRRK